MPTAWLSLDKDDNQVERFLRYLIAALQQVEEPWSRTAPGNIPMRGVPRTTPHIPVAVTHGLWANVPDLAADTQLHLPNYRIFPDGVWRRIHPPFPLSSMNFGFRRAVTPVMYQPAMGENWPFKRHDDIWLGLFCQRILKHFNYAFLNGGAVVWHTRMSDAQANLKAEAAGNLEHERFWLWVWGFQGAFIPVSEDAGMIRAVESGALSLEKLEAMTSVCSVGLDMIAIPGDTPVEAIAGIIADEAAIGVINGKTTAVRLLPAIGKKVGERLTFGGLLGEAPVMPVNSWAGSVFARRGGRFPAPLGSLRN